ncbi:MAG: hypothetical protein CSYNP_01417 [Syntrophus sp. SKADARSKE-3]|nr:hypothetical protein [Syntrophus sp. SKADARSKE-3]
MPILRKPPLHGQPKKQIVTVAVIFFALMLSWQFIMLVADLLWFEEVGYKTVFSVSLTAQFQSAAIFSLVFFLIIYINLFLAARLSSKEESYIRDNVINISFPRLDDSRLNRLILVTALIMGVVGGLYGTSRWESLLRFIHGVPFQLADPLFNHDIAFYVFHIPFIKQLYGSFMMALMLSTGGTAIVYLVRRAFSFTPPSTFHATIFAQRHLFILIAMIFSTSAFGFWLDLADLPFVKRGVVYGAGYTDVTTQVWVLYALSGLSILTGLSFILMIFRKDWRLPALTVVIFLLVMIAGRNLYPAIIQKLIVVPNEVVLEKPYLEQNIRFTRYAYGLDKIEDREFPAQENLTLKDIRQNDATIKNIRLWDYSPLLRTYGQLQEIRTYYKFLGVDNDRYMIDGEYRQIMLAPRELSYAALPSRTWVNEHLTYTHGYGAVMSPVNRITREGLPDFFIKDIPPASSKTIVIKRPEIYYSETASDYIFVQTKRPEFDYPVGDKNVYSRYEGKGGVPLSFLKKLLFAARFQSLTILLSDDITSSSRIMYYRNVKDRVSRIVPFASLDSDPYPVVSPEGRLLWIIDGYTYTDRFPYSEPTPKVGNYIRNSLKAVVDAYDGTVQLYISDPEDPIMATYARIFPGIFKKLNDMPEAIRSHVRYPPGMMSLQAHMYRTYHMRDPQVFYNKEDLWTIPLATTGNGEHEMRPYYTIMKLPNEKKEEVILLLPFTPSNKDNMSAWMAARCDMPQYGKLIVYNFPKQRLVYGPRQIVARINQDPVISQQLSLWNQRGSQVIPGSLLAIPIEQSILYIQSIYLASEKGQLPELKRIILAFGNTIVMEENLETALQRIFGGEQAREKTAVTATRELHEETQKPAKQLVSQAISHYRKAQEFMRQGNWAGFGDELKKLEGTLTTMEKSSR